MKKLIRNLFLALPLLFAVNFATPSKADAQIIIVPTYPRYVCGYQYVYGLTYQYVYVGGVLVLQPVYGLSLQYTCNWVY